MNQFRDLAICFLIFVGASLMFSNPIEWNWITILGDYFVSGVKWLCDLRPWSEMIAFALALALFMTRLRY